MPDAVSITCALFAGAAALAALLRATNLKRVKRGRQFLVPVASVLYAVGCGVAAVGWYEEIFQGITDVLPALVPFQLIAMNLAAFAAFLPIKLLCLALSSRWKKPSLMEATSGKWYEYDEDTGKWFLKVRYRDLASLASALAWAVALVCAASLAACILTRTEDSPEQLRVLPVLALIVATEVANFLRGLTKAEWEHLVGGAPITATRVNAYHKLRAVYERLLGSALLSANTSVSFGGKVGATDLIDRLVTSSDPVERTVGTYFSGLPDEDGFFDVDRVRATLTLMQGKSVVFFDPHYRDLGDYVLLPIVDALINNRGCLVVVGRRASCEDVSGWMRQILAGYSRSERLWRVGMLGSEAPECEVGVMSFSQIYDADVQTACGAFLSNVSVVLLVEPSRMLATSQVGLSLLAEHVRPDAVFCVCDHETDGLVDTLSHVLQTDITHACAGPVPRSIYTALGWDAAGDFNRHQLFGKQTRYLGNGVELAAIALKNDIPKVVWLSEERAPVQDLRWVAGQYYPQICAFVGAPVQQSTLDERIRYESGLWSLPVSAEAFVIAEDELFNMFATMRAYVSRGQEHSFVNVISENYLLRDYMRHNKQLFMNDPKAIPSIAPYYAKTERNAVIRFILQMVCEPVDESRVAHELNLIGLRSDDVYRELARLIEKYTGVRETIVSVQVSDETNDRLAPVRRTRYSISRPLFDRLFASTLKSAYVVVEDERLETEYVDTLLFGHITQIAMPGQLLVYAGKHYKVHEVSPRIGCVLHRAADSYARREYYRQLRTYRFERTGELVRSRAVMDVEVALEEHDFTVSSSGYLQMTDPHDLRTARLVDLSEDPGVDVYRRSYATKNVLRIMLPGTDVRVRFTMCLLLAELSRTLFPNAWPYLAFLAVRPDDVEGMLDMFCYRLEGDVREDAIYVVEDSEMDLGLVEAVDNSLPRILEILADYLDWHFEKMHEPPSKDPVLSPVVPVPGAPQAKEPAEEKRRGALQRVAERIQRLLDRFKGRGKEPGKGAEEPVPSEPAAEQPAPAEPAPQAEGPEGPGTAEPSAQEPSAAAEPTGPQADPALNPDPTLPLDADPRPQASAAPEAGKGPDAPAGKEAPTQAKPPVRDRRIPEAEVIKVVEERRPMTERDIAEATPIELMPEYRVRMSRYQRDCFLKFGFEDLDERLAIEDVSTYLTVRGWGDNDLTKARKREGIPFSALDLNTENHCDFCGQPLSGVSFERLQDGRVRCNTCSATAINDVDEYRRLFRRCEDMMQLFFDITIPVAVAVEMVDARTVAKRAGMIFRPSTGVAPRVLGFARKLGDDYSLVIENGSPRLAAIETTVHELTHLWQYLYWDDRDVRRIYRMPDGSCTERARLMLYEGMATWASVQFLYSLGETHYARQLESQLTQRRDEYGVGFILYRERYGFVTNGDTLGFTPFKAFPPLDPVDVWAGAKLLCPRGGACTC